MDKEIFNQEYSRLNNAQKEAVDSIDGPVMVVAGPGTGKTQILTLRIANILQKTDTPANGIVALTFTESAVFSMRKRLSQIIGSSAYNVNINTFHGFCNEVIKDNPSSFPKIIGSENITEIDQIKIIEEIISESKFQNIKPFGDVFYYVRPVLKAINSLKKEGVDPQLFSAILEKDEIDLKEIPDLYYEKGAHKGKMRGKYKEKFEEIEKNKEVSIVFKKYEERLEKNKFYDFSDMIMEVVKVLKENENLLLSLQEKYLYILVDEHQDTNNSQNKLLELLCNFYPNPNIFVVGDEKQAIFRFQGASLENFLYFKEKYPMAKMIILEENYRSTQLILDAAHSLIESKRKLKANTDYPLKHVNLFSFTKPEVENYFLATEIKNKIEKGTTPSSIAILYRDNKDAFDTALFLEKFGVSFVIESDQNILDDFDIRKIILLLRAVVNFGSQDVFMEAIHIDFLEIDPLDIYKIISFTNHNKISIYDAIKNNKIMDSLNLEDKEKIQKFSRLLSSWVTVEKNKGIMELFEIIIRESGALSYFLSDNDISEKMTKLNSFFDQIRGLVQKNKNYSLNDFLNYLDTLRVHNLLVKKESVKSDNKHVRLMTAHKSKGQEFDYVYITNIYDGHWGNKRKSSLLTLPERVFMLSQRQIENQNSIDDERRLFYVALTRAKKEVILTYSKFGYNGKEQIASQFIQEIDKNLLVEKDSNQYEDSFSQQKGILFLPSIENNIDIKNQEFIKESFLKNGLSVTALNNFIECPWKYFYTNLIRIPKAKSKHQMYGTAVHGALKDFFDKFKKEKTDKNYLIERYDFYLNKEFILNKDLDELRERGEKSLSNYFDYYKDLWPTNTITELNISGILLTPDIKLTGKIDKIELSQDLTHVNVIDYKTGKPKSRGEIEGTTANSNGDMKRQLVFYNLLLNMFDEGKYKMTGGDIDFIESNERGIYKKEHFEIENKEIKELEEMIKNVSDQILNLSFWNKGCDDKKCEFCQLRKLMRN